MAGTEYVRLTIHRPEGKRAKCVIALRSIAEFYGWTKEFEPWTPPVAYSDAHYDYVVCQGRSSNPMFHAGRRHHICRADDLNGFPKGMTNSFKLTRNCGLLDVAELAHFTTVDWHWMTSPYGERIRRDQWERIYQSGIPGRRGVACSV